MSEILNKNCIFCGYENLKAMHSHRQWSVIELQGYNLPPKPEGPPKLWYFVCGSCQAFYPIGSTIDDARDKAIEACDYLASQGIDKLLGNEA